MNVSIDGRLESFVDQLVKSGRYGSASEVVTEGLRLVEQREVKLAALKAIISASLTEGGVNTEEDVDRALDEAAAELAKEGF